MWNLLLDKIRLNQAKEFFVQKLFKKTAGGIHSPPPPGVK